MAPEIIQLQPVKPAADIWGLGCTIIELITGSPPYFDLTPMQAMFKIAESGAPPLPDSISPKMAAFLKLCFARDPLERPSAKELMKHPLLKSLNADGEVEDQQNNSEVEDSDHSSKKETESEQEPEEEDVHDQVPAEEVELQKWTKELNEMFQWFSKAMDKQNVQHAIRFRSGLRSKVKEMRKIHGKEDNYAPLFSEAKKLFRRCEDEMGEHIPMDLSSDDEDEDDGSEFEFEE